MAKKTTSGKAPGRASAAARRGSTTRSTAARRRLRPALLERGLTGAEIALPRAHPELGGLVAQVSCGVGVEQESVLRIYGADGWLLVPSPWFATVGPGETQLWLHRRGCGAPEEIVVRADRGLYTYEAEAFAAAVRAGQREVPAMPWADTLGNLTVLDAWRAECGVAHRGGAR